MRHRYKSAKAPPVHIYVYRGKRITERVAASMISEEGSPAFEYFYRGVQEDPHSSPAAQRWWQVHQRGVRATMRREGKAQCGECGHWVRPGQAHYPGGDPENGTAHAYRKVKYRRVRWRR